MIHAAAPTPKQDVKPTARAYAVSRPPLIDGRIEAGEWPGWSPGRQLTLLPLQVRDGSVPAAGSAYVLADDQALYVAARIPHPAPAQLRDQDGVWGVDDGVELDFQPVADELRGPVPDLASGVRVKVTATPAEAGFGFNMVGPILDVASVQVLDAPQPDA